jgi:hypothetical protein
MQKGHWLGIIGGISFFLVLYFFLFINPDFDQQLINQVEAGTSSQKLIQEIEKERSLEQDKAAKDLKSHFMYFNYWEGPKSVTNDDLAKHKEIYNSRLNAVSQLYELRMKYIRKEITKDEFSEKINDLKPLLES